MNKKADSRQPCRTPIESLKDVVIIIRNCLSSNSFNGFQKVSSFMF